MLTVLDCSRVRVAGEEEGVDWRRIPGQVFPEDELLEEDPYEEEEEEIIEDDGRPLPKIDDFIRLTGSTDVWRVAQTDSAIQPEFQLINMRTEKLVFQVSIG